MGVEKLRSLLFADDGITRRVDLPTIYQAKFVVAILMDQNIEGAVYIVNAISDQKHPRVVELRQRIRNWQSSLTFLEKIGFKGRRPFDLADIAVDDFW